MHGRLLTTSEIKALPLQMRCCFHLHPWTVDMQPSTIEEWARLVGWSAFVGMGAEPTSDYDRSRASTRAVFEAYRLHAFVRDVRDTHD